MVAQFGQDFFQEVMGRTKANLGEFMAAPINPAKDSGRYNTGGFLPSAAGTAAPVILGSNAAPDPAGWNSITKAWAASREAKAKADAATKKKEEARTYGQPGAKPGTAVYDVNAPTTAEGINSGNPDAFIPAALGLAQQALRERGMNEGLAPVMVGIAANETGYGAPRYSGGNRFFGIKGPGTGDMPTEEVIGGQRVTVQSSFRTYDTPLDSFRGFLEFLEQNPRYAGALQQAGSPAAFIRSVHQAGYATDPAWVTKVENIANRTGQYAQRAPGISPSTPSGQPNISWSRGVSQNELGLDPQTAATFCGPAAVMWFMNQTGRPPNLEETLNLAKEYGWNTSAGMSRGPTSVIEMIHRQGGSATMQGYYQGIENRVREEIVQGRPVLVDTPGHYFQIVGYNADANRFILGDAVGRRQQAGIGSLGELSNLGYGGPRQVIFRGD